MSQKTALPRAWSFSIQGQPAFGLLLLIGLIHGLVFVFLVPPWQHYDEPGHFEYAWLLANRHKLPEIGEVDQGMRRELAASMIEHRFFDRMNFRSNLLSQAEPIWIGISQTDDLPLYYFLVSLLLQLVRTSDITFQLYLGRLVSVFLLLLTLISAYGISAALTPPGHPIRWMVVAGLALLPGLIDLMSAMNNDTGATAFFSLFLWASVLAITQGLNWQRLLGLLITSLLCLYTKNTIAIAFLLAGIVLTFTLLRDTHRRIAWLVLVAGLLIGLGTSVSWGEASSWYRYISANQPARTANDQAPAGHHVFQFNLQPDHITDRLVQPIPASEVPGLRDKKLVLGAWIWASQPAEVWTPFLKDDTKSTAQIVRVTEEPTFYAIPVALSPTTHRAQIVLAPEVKQVESPVTVYYDSIVLLEGDGSISGEPEFANPKATQGSWQERPFIYPIRNASAENAGPWTRPWVDIVIRSFAPIRPSLILTAIYDWPITGRYYQATVLNLQQTFWARFGWGNVQIIVPQVYTFLWLFAVIGVIGAILAVIRLLRSKDWPVWSGGVIVLLGTAFLWIWFAALMRGVSSLLGGQQFIPASRYAFPAIIPTMLLFAIGWHEVGKRVSDRLRLPQWFMAVTFILIFVTLAILSWITIASFYGT